MTRLVGIASPKWKAVQLASGRPPPAYAVLSHTWSPGEVMLDDLKSGSFPPGKGLEKLKAACRLANEFGLNYLWVDTCCIDLNSYAEVSEAVNRKFTIFQDATVCIVHLADVVHASDLHRSMWFTLGRTLQELIGPSDVRFYNREWEPLGDRNSLAAQISAITRVPEWVLKQTTDRPITGILRRFSVAERFRWAASRTCQRSENTAYSLLGIFDVSLSLLYGERDKAFQRLQEAILKHSDDHSILAFRSLEPPASWTNERAIHTPVLAGHPNFFQDDIRTDWSAQPGRNRTTFLDGDLSIELLICQPLKSPFGLTPRDHHIGILDCVVGQDLLSRPAILLRVLEGSHKFLRIGNGLLFKVSPHNPTSCVLLGYEDNEEYQVTFNPTDAKRARITITTRRHETSLGPDGTAWKFPPVKLSGLDKLLEMGYCIANSTTPVLGEGYIVPQPAPDSVGIISLASAGDDAPVGLVVIWGFSPKYPSGPWCRIQTENDFAATKGQRFSLEFLSRQILDAREGDEATCLALRTDAANQRRMNSVVVGSRAVAVKIFVMTFIDRTTINLQFDVVEAWADFVLES